MQILGLSQGMSHGGKKNKTEVLEKAVGKV